MRKAWLAGCLLAVAVVVQLTVLNGLRLPGGGVPDLVLVAVAALALMQGPVYGMVAGFAAGLCIDIAPPASQLIGQYALVFCLAGWAAGRASRIAARSAVSSVLVLSLVVAAGEVLTAVLGLVLEPAQVTVAQSPSGPAVGDRLRPACRPVRAGRGADAEFRAGPGAGPAARRRAARWRRGGGQARRRGSSAASSSTPPRGAATAGWAPDSPSDEAGGLGAAGPTAAPGQRSSRIRVRPRAPRARPAVPVNLRLAPPASRRRRHREAKD